MEAPKSVICIQCLDSPHLLDVPKADMSFQTFLPISPVSQCIISENTDIVKGRKESPPGLMYETCNSARDDVRFLTQNIFF